MRADVIVALILVALLTVSGVAQWPLMQVSVDGASMEPTLHCANGYGCRAGESDHVLVNRFAYLFHGPRVGDIIVVDLHRKGTTYCATQGLLVKRVVAVPGMVPPQPSTYQTDSSTRLPGGDYFVMGDNKPVSCDSRSFGPVKRSEILGRVVAILWPIERLSIE